jgi:hypothetical protein
MNRRDALKAAAGMGLTVAGAVSAAARPAPVATGRQNDFVLMGSTGAGWKIHTGIDGSKEAGGVTIDRFSMGRTNDGTWWMQIRPDGDGDFPAYVTVDDPGAIAFLDAFTDLLIDSPAAGSYQFSNLTKS